MGVLGTLIATLDKARVQGAHKGMAGAETEAAGKNELMKGFQRTLNFIPKVLGNL